MTRICYGCGSKLQKDNSDLAGYVPAEKYRVSAYCQRCYRIMHYGMQFKSDTPKEIKSIVKAINNDNKHVVFLVDFLSIDTKVIDIFNQINQKKLLIISKSDIIPKSVKENMIKAFLVSFYHINTDIKLISSFNNYGVESLLNYFKKNKITESYIVGLSNSGKSTLVNKLIEQCESHMKKITTSEHSNTTLDFIRMQLKEDLLIIDSPGFILPSVNIPIKQARHKTVLKPKTFQMKAGETIKIENMYLNFSENTNITLYMNNELNVSKYFKEVKYDYETSVHFEVDLIISGLGFINIKNKCNITTSGIDPELIEKRESIFGEVHE